MSEHALLSASSASRWLACPPSARLESNYPDTTSEYAELGTLAHSLAELELRYATKLISKAVYLKRLNEINANNLFQPDMPKYVQIYVDYVMERYHAAQKTKGSATLIIEEKVDLTEYIPEGFGTTDAIIICDDFLEVVDLKYGQGVRVDAINNAQLRIYGLGAYDLYGLLYGFKKVTVTVVQPRLDNISSEILDLRELVEWGEAVKPAAQKAFNGEGELCPGGHCKFCKHKVHCTAFNADVAKAAKLAFAQVQPSNLSTEEIAELLSKKDIIVDYLTSVSEWALKETMAGNIKIAGYKLVQGRANRRYADEFAIDKTLFEAGYNINDLYESKMIGVTKLEKLLGNEFDKLIGQYIIKPAGAPTLVPITDKRPEYNPLSAEEAFKNIEIKEIS